MLKNYFIYHKSKYSKRINLFLQIIFSFLYVILLSLSVSFGDKTLDADLYRFTNQINDWYNHPIDDPYVYPIVNIEQDGKKIYKDLFDKYYYTNSSTEVSSVRQLSSIKSIPFKTSNGNSYSVCINKQDFLTIYSKGQKGYNLEYNLFETYYKDEILGYRGYLSTRFGCNGFCFISDTFANKLLLEYNISTYDELILDERYAVVQIEYEGKVNRLCINNILYSSIKNGPRLVQLYGDFCVAYGGNIVMNNLPYAIEFDLKSDYYTTKQFFKDVNKMGYTTKNTKYSFYLMNDKGGYVINENLSKSLDMIDFNKDDSPYIIFVAVSTSAYVMVCFFLVFIGMFYMNLLNSLVFAFYCVVNIFICNAPICNLFMVIGGAASIVAFIFGYSIWRYKRRC